MQRGTFRVHGCARCKRRKCDNKVPCCSQCKRLEKPCPGSDTGHIFLNMGIWTPKVQACGPIVAYNQHQEAICRLAVHVGSFHLSPWTPHHWLFVLPQLKIPEGFREAIVLPLRAMSFAFKALQTEDATLRRKAFECYTEGLAQQRHLLLLLMRGRWESSRESILWPLLVALSLLEFEMMAPSSLHSWSGHAYGSLHLLARLGPEACQKSPFFELFCQLRFIMGYATTLTGKLSSLSQPAWLEIPFYGRAKTFLDNAVDYGLTGYRPNGTASRGTQSNSTLAASQSEHVPAPLTLSRSVGEMDGMTMSQLMMQILSNTMRLQLPFRPDMPLEVVKAASGSILRDAGSLLSQSSTSFRMALQCVFAVHLVSLVTPCSTQRTRAETTFNYWHKRLTLQVPYNI